MCLWSFKIFCFKFTWKLRIFLPKKVHVCFDEVIQIEYLYILTVKWTQISTSTHQEIWICLQYCSHSVINKKVGYFHRIKLHFSSKSIYFKRAKSIQNFKVFTIIVIPLFSAVYAVLFPIPKANALFLNLWPKDLLCLQGVTEHLF